MCLSFPSVKWGYYFLSPTLCLSSLFKLSSLGQRPSLTTSPYITLWPRSHPRPLGTAKTQMIIKAFFVYHRLLQGELSFAFQNPLLYQMCLDQGGKQKGQIGTICVSLSIHYRNLYTPPCPSSLYQSASQALMRIASQHPARQRG